ncbi:MAG: AAA family ATPase [Gemmatimonadaceae bacterium]|nr:AAA family ATPase [Gemmatimonadaceae bacterium]
MRIVAIINQKGGCGKTTTSINLAACLARLGQKTLLVDMDPQGHCGVGLAVPEEQIERTIYDALIDPSDGRVASMEEVAWQIATDFDLAPSNIKLAGFEQVFAGRAGREDRLATALNTVRDKYEWAILDCPPSVGLLTFNALKCCDEAIVPVETGYFSLHGLTKMMETLEVMRKQCNKEIMVRVLPTLYDTRTKLAREVLSELRSKFRDYLMESTVNFNTKLKEAASFGQPITEYDPGSRGYKDFVNLARELMGHRPVEIETTSAENMGLLSRPAELVQRAKQLAQLTNYQFGRGTIPAQPVAQPTAQPTVQIAQPAQAPAPSPAPAPVAAPRLAALDPRTVNASDNVTITHISPPPVMQISPKSTDQKLSEFYGVKKIGDDVIFAVNFQDAKKVLVAGDFNNWMPVSTPMASGMRPGMWVAKLPLPPGRYRYRLVVDGKWMTDPNNKYVETNEYGELNNVVEVAA